MNIIRSWREQKVMLKWWFPVLCEEDFIYEADDRESMLKKLGSKLKKTREEIDFLFSELQRY